MTDTATTYRKDDLVDAYEADGSLIGYYLLVVAATVARVAVKVPNFDGTFRTLVVPVDRVVAAEEEPYDYGRTCSLCDAVGHGYPGAGPCPLEERGWMDADEDLRRFGAY
jgi:hypothetical protein